MKKIIVYLLVLFVANVSYGQVSVKSDPCKEMYKVYKENCVGVGLDGFSRAIWSWYYHYEKTFNTKKFDYYCNAAIDEKNILSFDQFKKEVCKQDKQKSISGTIPKKVKMVKETPIQEIDTRYGKINLVTQPNREIPETIDAFIKFNQKKIAICASCYTDSFDEEFYQIENINVYSITYAIGNAYEGGMLFFDTPTGIYYTNESKKIDMFKKDDDSIKMFYKERPGTIYVFTYKSGKMFESKSDKKIGKMMKKL